QTLRVCPQIQGISPLTSPGSNWRMRSGQPYNRRARRRERGGTAMSGRRGRVVALVLDGCGPECARPGLTPNLLRLAESGGMAPAGGLADLVASTGPGHASLLTGVRSTVHGVLANRILDERGLPTEAVSVAVPTVIDRAREAGCSTA